MATDTKSTISLKYSDEKAIAASNFFRSEASTGSAGTYIRHTVVVSASDSYVSVDLPEGQDVKGFAFEVKSGDGVAVFLADNVVPTEYVSIPDSVGTAQFTSMGCVVLDGSASTTTFGVLIVYSKTGTTTDTIVDIVLFG